MFKFVRALLRHKVGVVAVIAFAVFVFSNGKGEEQAAPSSPWAKDAPIQASGSNADEGSIGARIGEMASAAGDYAAENILGDKDLNPVKMGTDTAGRFDDANQAFAKANSK